MKIIYSSNNSGGYWWLGDKDWKALEKEGWTIEWRDKPFIGTLATRASKEFDNMNDAILEWERIVNQNADEEGCQCCGQPHEFYEV